MAAASSLSASSPSSAEARARGPSRPRSHACLEWRARVARKATPASRKGGAERPAGRRVVGGVWGCEGGRAVARALVGAIAADSHTPSSAHPYAAATRRSTRLVAQCALCTRTECVRATLNRDRVCAPTGQEERRAATGAFAHRPPPEAGVAPGRTGRPGRAWHLTFLDAGAATGHGRSELLRVHDGVEETAHVLVEQHGAAKGGGGGAERRDDRRQQKGDGRSGKAHAARREGGGRIGGEVEPQLAEEIEAGRVQNELDGGGERQLDQPRQVPGQRRVGAGAVLAGEEALVEHDGGHVDGLIDEERVDHQKQEALGGVLDARHVDQRLAARDGVGE
eukprot:scaffold4184_cov120-Isochrysis_galbana.AAC.7